MIRPRCWICVYSSFTACRVLLLSASQNLLALSLDDVGRDLAYASSYMDLLSFCSGHNSTAKTFYRTLQPIFNNLRDLIASPVCDRLREMQVSITAVASHHGAVTDGSKETSQEILEVTQRVILLLTETSDAGGG